MPQDALQSHFNVGDIVNIPIKITAVGGTSASPTVTGSTKFLGFDAAADSITVDANQVVVDH